MSDPRTQSPETKLGSIDIGSTSEIMQKLAEFKINFAGINIPEDAPNQLGVKITILEIAQAEHYARQAEIDLKENSGDILMTLSEIQTCVDKLGEISPKEGKDAESYAASQLADGRSRIQERSKLAELHDRVMEENAKTIVGTVKAAIDLTTPPQEIPNKFAPIMQNIEEIVKQTARLKVNEQATQTRLDTVREEILRRLNAERTKRGLPQIAAAETRRLG